ncbi:molecular chaperone [Halostella sp. JP-L12]|uniref:molecular chaperone TorD family protein n=1 Tax=Halostella TaxID=1843185 RepID=UPI000EF7F51D|nr:MULTISPECIES: molecular chaperone TorD family protein [Halostella]NHN47765.1 molecular chaperone [Halostella sp. JP-L12]
MTTDPDRENGTNGAGSTAAEAEAPVAELDPDAGARGAAYALLARAFGHPEEPFYDALSRGSVAAQFESLFDETTLDVDAPAPTTDDDYETLCARYNDLFVVGHAEYEDRTDGTVNSTGPPVPLYESAYRSDVSWNDVNLDLARAYDYYDLGVDESDRDHHDHLRLQLEFAGYLARRESLEGEGADAARLDFLDRHLRVITEGVVERLDEEPGTGAYGDLAALLDAFTAADRADLVTRVEG